MYQGKQEGTFLHTDSIYEYYGRQKNDMEASVIPFVVFQYIDNALHIVLISDGMCRLLLSFLCIPPPERTEASDYPFLASFHHLSITR